MVSEWGSCSLCMLPPTTSRARLAVQWGLAAGDLVCGLCCPLPVKLQTPHCTVPAYSQVPCSAPLPDSLACNIDSVSCVRYHDTSSSRHLTLTTTVYRHGTHGAAAHGHSDSLVCQAQVRCSLDDSSILDSAGVSGANLLTKPVKNPES